MKEKKKDGARAYVCMRVPLRSTVLLFSGAVRSDRRERTRRSFFEFLNFFFSFYIREVKSSQKSISFRSHLRLERYKVRWFDRNFANRLPKKFPINGQPRYLLRYITLTDISFGGQISNIVLDLAPYDYFNYFITNRINLGPYNAYNQKAIIPRAHGWRKGPIPPPTSSVPPSPP